MYKRQETKDGWGFVGDVAKIALGVFIGIMAVNGVEEAIARWRIEQASRQMMQELNAMKEKEQQHLQQQKERQDQLRRQGLERDWQRQQQEFAAKRKEKAWANFFQPSYTCRVDPSRGDCADVYIRTRKVFEAQYLDD